MTHRFSLLLYSNMKLYHDGAAVTSSVIDAKLILMRMPEYYQIADSVPFTSNAIQFNSIQFNSIQFNKLYNIDSTYWQVVKK